MEKAREKKLIADILAMLISYIDSYLIESSYKSKLRSF